MLNRLLLSLVFVAIVSSAIGQRIYFVYIQSESGQPFFVKMQESVFSSTASGYIVLSRLKDSTYTFAIGFPGNQFGEQKFTCSIQARDHGYLLKNAAGQGWALYDLQNASVIQGIDEGQKTRPGAGKPVSAFTELLSKAADDSTLKEDIVISSYEQATDKNPVQTADAKTVKKDSVSVSQRNENAETVKPVSGNQVTTVAAQKEEKPNAVQATSTEEKTAINMQAPFERTRVTRKSETSTTAGFGLVYTDEYPDGRTDTISILIPDDNKYQLVVNEQKNEGQQQPDVKKETNGETTKIITPNNCHEVASDDDFFRLRKKMAAQKHTDKMLAEAEKVFRTKCFSTEQLRNLSTLFLTNEGKYKFFDAAYSKVSDLENFPSLQAELTDAYYIKRFKAMLHN
jgi:hypothetical protein